MIQKLDVLEEHRHPVQSWQDQTAEDSDLNMNGHYVLRPLLMLLMLLNWILVKLFLVGSSRFGCKSCASCGSKGWFLVQINSILLEKNKVMLVKISFCETIVAMTYIHRRFHAKQDICSTKKKGDTTCWHDWTAVGEKAKQIVGINQRCCAAPACLLCDTQIFTFSLFEICLNQMLK